MFEGTKMSLYKQIVEKCKLGDNLEVFNECSSLELHNPTNNLKPAHASTEPQADNSTQMHNK